MGSSRTATELARQLAELTGDLSAAPQRLDDLERVRRLIVRGGAGDAASARQDTKPAVAPTAQMRLMAFEAAAATDEAEPGIRVVRREESIAPNGAAETLGPFFTPERRRVWFDLFTDAALSPTTVSAGAGSFLIFTGTITSADGLTYDVPAGGVWVAAAALLPGAFAQRFIGFLVTSGKLTLSSPAVVAGTKLTINAATTSVLELAIEQPASSPYFTPPSSVRIDFTGGGSTAFQAATARISVNGVVVDLDPTGPASVSPDGFFLQFGGGTTIVSATASSSDSIEFAGEWQIVSTNWVFNPESQDVVTLPTNSGLGLIQAGAGVTLFWRGAGGPLALNAATLQADTDSFAITAHSTTRGVRQQLVDAGEVIGNFGFDTTSPLFIVGKAQPPESRLIAHASVDLAARRPLTADGLPVRVSSPSANFLLIDSGGAVQLSIQVQPKTYRTALAVSNAVLTVEGPMTATFQCGLDADAAVAGGKLFCTFALRGTLPILPDPYVANFEPQPLPGVTAQVVAGATWAANEDPAVSINLGDPNTQALALQNSLPQPLDDQLVFGGFHTSRLVIARFAGRISPTHWLLDVSTNAGQFGVAIAGHRDSPKAAIDSSSLQWYGLDTLVFSVPSIQWEPVADSTGLLLTTDDGGPSVFAVNSVRLVPVAPAEATRVLVEDLQGGASGRASITLPFGIRATIMLGNLDEGVPGHQLLPKITLDEPKIVDLQSPPRLRFEAPLGLGMLGNAMQTDNIFQAGTNTNVLKFKTQDGAQAVSDIFNQSFQNLVPLNLYDWSGFGASSFSHWALPALIPPNVSQVQFEVLNGRCAHEVVQVTARLWPCQAVVVRTITIERGNNASVVKHDSGWIASTDGLFTYAGTKCVFHVGLAGGYTRIREIRDTPRTVITAGGAQLQQVFFDADLEIQGVIGGNRGADVHVQRHAGYVHFLPVGTDLSPADLQDLLRQEGPIGGQVDCEIDVGGSGTKMQISKLLCETALRPPGVPGDPEFVVSLNGMPQFPKTGDWTAVRTINGQTSAVDQGKGVPVIGQAGEPLRFSEPADLFSRASPVTKYGFLFSTGSSRLLMPCPEVAIGDRTISSQFQALMADPSAVAITNGLFPKTEASLEFPAPYTLDFDAPAIFNQSAAKRSTELVLVANKVMRLYVEANTPFDAAINAVDWKTASADQTLFLDLLGYVKLLSVTGKWAADSDGARKFADPVMTLSDQLDQVKEILDLLNNLKLPFDMDFSLKVERAGTLALEASMEGQLADPDGNAIDTGMGKLSGLLRLGVIVRASISNGVQGYAYLEVSGDLQQAIIPGLLYAGGHLRFRAGVFDNGDIQLEFTAGTVGSIGGDLIKGLIEVEGTAKYGYSMVVPTNNLEQIRIGVMMGMEVRATLLSGLVGIKFGWEGGALMSLDEPKTHVIITAYVSASASVTAAWVFHTHRSVNLEYTASVPRGVVLAVLAVTTFGAGAAAGPALLA